MTEKAEKKKKYKIHLADKKLTPEQEKRRQLDRMLDEQESWRGPRMANTRGHLRLCTRRGGRNGK